MKIVKLFFWMMVLLLIGSGTIFAEDSFTIFTEYTSDGVPLKIDTNRFMNYVDINSTIHVDFSLEELGYNSDVVNSEESQKLRKEVEALNELLVQGRNEMVNYTSKIGDLRKNLLKNPTPELDEEFKETLNRHGKFILNLFDVLEPVFSEDRIDQAMSKSDPQYTELLNLLAEHVQNTQHKLYEETMTLIENKQMTLSVWCIQNSVNQKPTAIHLPNYDNLEMGTREEVKKISYAMSDEERKHIEENYQLYQSIQDVVKDIKNKNSDLRQMVLSMKEQLLNDLDELKGLFGPADFQSILDELNTGISNLPINQETEKLKATWGQMESQFEKLTNLQAEYSEIVKDISEISEGNLDVLVSLITEKLDLLNKLMINLRSIYETDYYDQLIKSVEQFQTLVTDAAKAIPETLYQKLSDFLKTKSSEWLTSLANLEKILEKYDFYTKYQSVFLGFSKWKTFASAMEGGTSSPELKPQDAIAVGLAKAPSTVIDIPTTRRKEGDVYTLHLQIMGKEMTTINQEYSFMVKRYGLYNQWVNNFVFIYGGWQSSIQGGFSASWILHYGIRPNESGKRHFGDYIYSGINPGIGLSAVMISDKEKVNYGLGAAITLLNDNLEIGGGVNFGEVGNGNRAYYIYVGAALFDWLNPASMWKKGMEE